MFKDMLKREIMAERSASMQEKYRDERINYREFYNRWGQLPSKTSIIRGPRCLTIHRAIDPDPYATGRGNNSLTGDTRESDRELQEDEWETVGEEPEPESEPDIPWRNTETRQ